MTPQIYSCSVCSHAFENKEQAQTHLVEFHNSDSSAAIIPSTLITADFLTTKLATMAALPSR